MDNIREDCTTRSMTLKKLLKESRTGLVGETLFYLNARTFSKVKFAKPKVLAEQLSLDLSPSSAWIFG